MWGYAPHTQTYQRGGVLFEITSGGKFPPQSLRDVPPPFITKVWCITGGVERGRCPLSVGGQGTKRFLVNLWILSFHKKVSPGCRGGEPPCKRNRFAETYL